MKKLLYISVAVALASASCKKELEKFPQGQLTGENVFTQANDYKLAIDAAYLPLTNRFRGNWDWDDGGGIPRDWVIGDVMSDDAVKGGGSLGDQEDMRRMETFSIFPENNNVLGVWRYNFKGINAANTILLQEATNVPGMDAALLERIKGEAYFLRAFYYFRLVVNFGQVPLMIPEKGLTDNTKKATLAELYAQIESDLAQAIGMLDPSYGPADYQRATVGAAHALLAKTFLYRKEWQKCLDQIVEVEKGPYHLLDKFQDNFNGTGEQAGETIFAARHESGLTPSQGSILNAVWAPQGKGWGFNIPTQDLVNEFETGDPRLAATIMRAGDKWVDGTTNYDPAWSPLTGLNVRKFMSNSALIDDGGIDYIYIRLGDVLLWKAECYANLDQPALAQAPLELVRGRARKYAANPATNLPAVTTNDKTALLAAIRHERRVELAFEGQRYYDLVRWDLARTVLAAAPDTDPLKGYKDYGNGWQSFNTLLPIPQREADLLGLEQNDGYKK